MLMLLLLVFNRDLSADVKARLKSDSSQSMPNSKDADPNAKYTPNGLNKMVQPLWSNAIVGCVDRAIWDDDTPQKSNSRRLSFLKFACVVLVSGLQTA